MPLSFFALAFALIAPPAHHPAHKTPPPCHSLTESQFREPLTLTEPCYIVTDFISISAPLTINPGTTILFGGGAALVPENGGSINATGTPEKPIILRGKEHAPGYWTGLRISSNSPNNKISYVTVEDAGQKGGSDEGAIQVGVGARLSIDHTTVRNSASAGINVLQRGVLSHFEANHFENDNTPLSIKASDAAMMDAATTFTNNQHNYVLIHSNDSDIEDDATWHALAVPYHLEATPSIKAHLTIEPGARLEFAQGYGINVDDKGSLSASGNPAHPITFTGAEEAPGFWDGIYFASNSPRNVLSNVVIKYGGQKSGLAHGGAGLAPRASATVRASEIAFSATAAIFVGQNATLNTDAGTTNRFHDNAQGIVQDQ